jgi:hypothetical protein
VTGAVIYVEAGQRPVAGGRWHVLGDVVHYERAPGQFESSIIAAHTLRTSESWRVERG